MLQYFLKFCGGLASLVLLAYFYALFLELREAISERRKPHFLQVTAEMAKEYFGLHARGMEFILRVLSVIGFGYLLTAWAY